jgi:hypothetical protein
MKTKFSLVALAIVLAVSNTYAAPSNDEIYKMLLEIKKENIRLKAEIESLKKNVGGQTASVGSSVNQTSSNITASQQSSQTIFSAEKKDPKSKYNLQADIISYSFYSNNGADGAASNANFSTIQPRISGRLSGTYLLDDDFGIRARLFRYTPKDSYNVQNEKTQFKTTLYDLEGIAYADLKNWELAFFGGIRAGKLDWSHRYGYTQTFSGIGPTLGVDIKRQLNSDWAIIGGTRFTQLLGKTKSTSSPSDRPIKNTSTQIFDANLGVEYTQKLGVKEYITYGLGYELTQFNKIGNLVNVIDPEDVDVTLSGPRLSIRYSFD